jgi:hypothetical protein
MAPPRHGKRDMNEARIVRALRAVGATVEFLSKKGCPDLLVGYQGQNWLFEVKTESGKLTPDEIEWFDGWQGQRAIVRSADEALEMLGITVWKP